MYEDEIFSVTNACGTLAQQVDERYTLQIVENTDGSWSVSLQLISDAVTGRPVNLFNTVTREDRLEALQAMASQLESMLP